MGLFAALTVHGLQLGLDREDEDLDVRQGVPAVAAAGAGNAPANIANKKIAEENLPGRIMPQ